MKIALVVGHRLSNQGSYGNKGISEFEYWSDVVSDLREQYAHDYNIQVFFRQDKRGYSKNMRELHRRIDGWGADIALELHFNGSGNKNVTGHEVLYSSRGAKKYATYLNKLFAKHLKTKDRGIKRIRTKKERGGGFLLRGKSKCLIAEPFFGSHQHLYTKDSDGGYGKIIASLVDFIEGVRYV